MYTAAVIQEVQKKCQCKKFRERGEDEQEKKVCQDMISSCFP